jgi:autotransporter strand-loop-strand O-heptosyltransferase
LRDSHDNIWPQLNFNNCLLTFEAVQIGVWQEARLTDRGSQSGTRIVAIAEERIMDGDFTRLALEDVSASEPGLPPRSVADAGDSKPAYPPTSALPTQEGPHGITYDFNMGARVRLPKGQWRIQLRDQDTGNVLFDSKVGEAYVTSTKRYFVRHEITVWNAETEAEIFRHQYSAQDKDVLVQFPVGTLGDMLAWFPYAVRFQKKHGCRLTCALGEKIIPLLRDAYPDIRFVTHEECAERKLHEIFYATYSLGLFFDDADCIWQPTDFRHVGLHKTAAYILGVDPAEAKPKLVLPDESRPIPEPYVCIGVQSSSQPKYWNNPHGWPAIVRFLKDAGYRVVCIDQRSTHGAGLVWNHIPHGVEDQTGDAPLTERARWLRHADFFIGCSSGLSWLAWAAGTPVVMISGFTHPTNEFETPYRVINWHACNSCWNDVRHRFQHHDFLWCPRHAGTERQFECTKLITADQVKAAIQRIPAFAAMHAGGAANLPANTDI